MRFATASPFNLLLIVFARTSKVERFSGLQFALEGP